jgi:hypothetical protein
VLGHGYLLLAEAASELRIDAIACRGTGGLAAVEAPESLSQGAESNQSLRLLLLAGVDKRVDVVGEQLWELVEEAVVRVCVDSEVGVGE